MTTHVDVRMSNLHGPEIELPTEMGDVDLHNFADFNRLVFSSDGTLQLEWVTHEPGKFRIGQTPIAAASLVFDQVGRVVLTPRDAEIAPSEDRALDHFVVEEASPESCRIRFVFVGGRELDVTAGLISLVIEEAAPLAASA